MSFKYTSTRFAVLDEPISTNNNKINTRLLMEICGNDSIECRILHPKNIIKSTINSTNNSINKDNIVAKSKL